MKNKDEIKTKVTLKPALNIYESKDKNRFKVWMRENNCIAKCSVTDSEIDFDASVEIGGAIGGLSIPILIRHKEKKKEDRTLWIKTEELIEAVINHLYTEGNDNSQIQTREQYLCSLMTNPTELQDKFKDSFESQARYLGNGIYEWGGIYGTNTRVLFLEGILEFEGIPYDKIDKEDE